MAEVNENSGEGGVVMKNGGVIIINDDGGNFFWARQAIHVLENRKQGTELVSERIQEALAFLKKTAASQPDLTIKSTVPLDGLVSSASQRINTKGLTGFTAAGHKQDVSAVTDCGVESGSAIVIVTFESGNFSLTLRNGTLQFDRFAAPFYYYFVPNSGPNTFTHVGIKGSMNGIDYLGRNPVEIHGAF